MVSVFSFSFIGFSDVPTPFIVHSSRRLSVGSLERSHHRKPLGMRGSACVEVMTTLRGSAPSLWRRAEGCVPPDGTITSARDLLKSTIFLLEPP